MTEAIDWDALPRLLQELCDGHPAIMPVVYGRDGGHHRVWLCKSCYLAEITQPVTIDLTALAKLAKPQGFTGSHGV